MAPDDDDDTSSFFFFSQEVLFSQQCLTVLLFDFQNSPPKNPPALSVKLYLCLQVYELSPETWAWCQDTAVLAWEATLHYSIWLWKHALHLALEAEHWLKEHVLT